MQAILPHQTMQAFANQRDTQDSEQELAPEDVGPVVQSADLLKGAKAMAIHHNGSVYRLQTTKLGKLILTK